jgi:hypothetical protein
METSQEKKHVVFEINNGVKISEYEYAFKTQADANEYAKLKCEWWGSNLVYLGAAEKNGLWHPGFNVWD